MKSPKIDESESPTLAIAAIVAASRDIVVFRQQIKSNGNLSHNAAVDYAHQIDAHIDEIEKSLDRLISLKILEKADSPGGKDGRLGRGSGR